MSDERVEPVAGAYGLAFPELAPTRRLLEAEPGWPSWAIRWQRPGSGAEQLGDDTGESWDDERATLQAQPAGRILIERSTCRTTLLLPEAPSDEALVHPYLSSTAIVAGHWLGRATFHAGAFALDGQVWGVLGGRTTGKTSTLFLLHERGIPIVTDDVLIVDGVDAYSGPRCLDLREDVAHATGQGRYVGVLGSRERWRVDLPSVPGRLPMAGWIVLAWSDAEVDLERLPAASRMAALVANRGLLAPAAEINGLLDLLALPAVRFARPQDRSSAAKAVTRLLDTLAEL